jgi:hypothetical protein
MYMLSIRLCINPFSFVSCWLGRLEPLFTNTFFMSGQHQRRLGGLCVFMASSWILLVDIGVVCRTLPAWFAGPVPRITRERHRQWLDSLQSLFHIPLFDLCFSPPSCSLFHVLVPLWVFLLFGSDGWQATYMCLACLDDEELVWVAS